MTNCLFDQYRIVFNEIQQYLHFCYPFDEIAEDETIIYQTVSYKKAFKARLYFQDLISNFRMITGHTETTTLLKMSENLK